MSFKDLNLSNGIMKAITAMGFETPTPIQAETIPLLLNKRDVIGQAQTGTGKTAAFGIPILEMDPSPSKKPTSIVLCPTRELAIQVAQEIQRIAKFLPDKKVLPVFGGESISKQIHDLSKGVSIVVGTPGRVLDHLNRGTLSFQSIQMVVLDEADEMLNMGFREDIENLLSMMPADKQILLFSATMPKPIMEIAKKFLKNPAFIRVTPENLTAVSVEQAYFDAYQDERLFLIQNLIEYHSLKSSMVFCNTRKQVNDLVSDFQSLGMIAEGLHGELNQNQRITVLNRFKKGDNGILVATDVAARGLDIPEVEAVFNFDMPLDPEYYVHRIGRTGRAGKSGLAFSFITGRNDARRLKNIQDFARVSIQRKNAPSSAELFEAKKLRLLAQVYEQLENQNTKNYFPVIDEFYKMGIAPRDLCAALLQLHMPLSPITTPGHLSPNHLQEFRGSNSKKTKTFSDGPGKQDYQKGKKSGFSDPKSLKTGKSKKEKLYPGNQDWKKQGTQKAGKKDSLPFYYN
jgi:ATP-dependent RNA helicase DeaD